MNVLTLPWNIIVGVAKIVCDADQLCNEAFYEGFDLGQQTTFDRLAEHTHLEPQDGKQHLAPLHHSR